MPPRYTKPREDDAYFPVRVRVLVPANGFGQQLNQIYAWLDEQAGRGRWAEHSAALPEGRDAVAFYFMDTRMARAFVDRFACAMAVPAGEREVPRDYYGGGFRHHESR